MAGINHLATCIQEISLRQYSIAIPWRKPFLDNGSSKTEVLVQYNLGGRLVFAGDYLLTSWTSCTDHVYYFSCYAPLMSFVDQKLPSAAMESTTHSSPSAPSGKGSFLKELDDLKKLLQQTMEETKACYSTEVAKPNDAASQELHSKDLLHDIRREVSEISQIVKTKGSERVSTEEPVGLYEQLRQTIEENHQRFTATIYQTYQNLMEVHQMHHLEVIRAIQEKQSNPTRR